MFYLFWEAITKKYFQLKGRANRKEYVIFVAIYFILESIIDITELTIKQDLLKMFITITIITVLAYLAIPSITIIVRRLHDLNLSGFWIFLDIPIIMILYLLKHQNIGITVSWIVSLILLLFKGTKGTNKYGEEPK